MRKVLLAVLGLGTLVAGCTAAQAGEGHPVVVELYTSQGCSSCPPADALLAKLAKRKGLIAMSLPITYWDMLGWKDTLASEANTRRQKAYASALGRGGVYTPQMIIDGTADAVGSRAEQVEDAIAAAEDAQEEAADQAEEAKDIAEERAEEGIVPVSTSTYPPAPPIPPVPPHAAWSVDVGLTQNSGTMHVAIAAAPRAVKRSKPDATIWMFSLRSAVTVHIGAGENENRTMTYRNVVGDIKAVGRWKGDAISLDLPRADPKTPRGDGTVVVVQQSGYGRVIGAAYLGHADYYAQR